ncbi:hypothetical protein Syun_030632 [Stephania yunnanensis]|uniref:Uncharacterized protein n=1 Tax=Stephania yunnanensis TaxID=152371 RepID=A0AAP0HC26_9MAGN
MMIDGTVTMHVVDSCLLTLEAVGKTESWINSIIVSIASPAHLSFSRLSDGFQHEDARINSKNTSSLCIISPPNK